MTDHQSKANGIPNPGECRETAGQLGKAIDDLMGERGDQTCCRIVALADQLAKEICYASWSPSIAANRGMSAAGMIRQFVFDRLADPRTRERMSENLRQNAEQDAIEAKETLGRQFAELGIDPTPVFEDRPSSDD